MKFSVAAIALFACVCQALGLKFTDDQAVLDTLGQYRYDEYLNVRRPRDFIGVAIALADHDGVDLDIDEQAFGLTLSNEVLTNSELLDALQLELEYATEYARKDLGPYWWYAVDDYDYDVTVISFALEHLGPEPHAAKDYEDAARLAYRMYVASTAGWVAESEGGKLLVVDDISDDDISDGVEDDDFHQEVDDILEQIKQIQEEQKLIEEKLDSLDSNLASDAQASSQMLDDLNKKLDGADSS